MRTQGSICTETLEESNSKGGKSLAWQEQQRGFLEAFPVHKDWVVIGSKAWGPVSRGWIRNSAS